MATPTATRARRTVPVKAVQVSTRPVVSPTSLTEPSGHRYKMQMMRVGDLMVDPPLQRDFRPEKAKKIAKNFDEKMLGTIEVSVRSNGDNHICEGQHRYRAALDKFGPDYQLPCKVHYGLSRVDEARMFYGFDAGRTKMPAFDRYRVGLEAREAWCVEVEKALMANGLTMAKGPSTNQVAAVEACKRIVARFGGSKGLEEALWVSEQAFGRYDEAWNADLIQAIAEILHTNVNLIDVNGFISRLADYPVSKWKQLAHSYVQGGGGSTSRAGAMAKAMKDHYNLRRRTKRLP